MESKIRIATGASFLLSWMPAFSQEATSTKKLAVASCASCPSGDGVIVVSGDPTWLIASFVVGVVVGVVLAKVLGGMKRQ